MNSKNLDKSKEGLPVCQPQNIFRSLGESQLIISNLLKSKFYGCRRHKNYVNVLGKLYHFKCEFHSHYDHTQLIKHGETMN